MFLMARVCECVWTWLWKDQPRGFGASNAQVMLPASFAFLLNSQAVFIIFFCFFRHCLLLLYPTWTIFLEEDSQSSQDQLSFVFLKKIKKIIPFVFLFFKLVITGWILLSTLYRAYIAFVWLFAHQIMACDLSLW